ncbi:polyamine ABC transporter ATP-binding protein [Ensifer sp. NM-2]|uniref:ABC transporter ATP-binding protein n=1 Tax=Ensifer sp. NM-2 TaxID=2109730 RepID=UPI000D135DE6|nr:ABC transporter ATP-binding protein [Ensifer sp. NM-2]PSS59995.1 polyamine ABC transporter ATP-binding protein [Ensifer sp. NM-2]
MIGEEITLKGVRKSYGSTVAVEPLNLEITAGEFVSILGPSGSGKTTLLTMIAGFEYPDEGRISVGNRDITRVVPNKRGIGMVFQKYALFPHLTVAENVAFPLRMRRQSPHDIRTRVAAALDIVQLSAFAARYPHELSGGQQQRVAVARALVFRPPVLLMDEPLGALDKKLRESMQFEIKALQKSLGVTVVYVTHDQEEALTMSDRVAVMAGGKLAQIGSPHELYDEPRDSFVADFIGKMNFVPGRVIGREADEMIIRAASSELFRLNARKLAGKQDQLVQLAFRPERARLVRKSQARPGALGGTVSASVFVGSHHMYVVDVSGDDTRPVHVQAEPGSDVRFSAGDEVEILPDPAHLTAFPLVEVR